MGFSRISSKMVMRSQIMDRETTELSMMSEGLLEYLDDPEIINLFAYLQSLDPIPIE